MKKNLFFVLIFTLFLFFLFVKKDVITKSSIEAVTLWQNKIFPSLFISFIIQNLLINYNASYYISFLFNKIYQKLFGLSQSGQLALTLSFISGSPSNAYILTELYLNKFISEHEANHILQFSYFANPLFLYTMLLLIFGSLSVSLKIIFSLYLSNIILGISLKKENYVSSTRKISSPDNFGFALTSSIKKSMNTLIMILGSVTFFITLSNLFSIYVQNDFINLIFTGILELTSGLDDLIYFDISYKLKEIITTLFISFGGLCIHSQVYSILCESNLSYLYFLKGRFLASIIAILIITII